MDELVLPPRFDFDEFTVKYQFPASSAQQIETYLLEYQVSRRHYDVNSSSVQQFFVNLGEELQPLSIEEDEVLRFDICCKKVAQSDILVGTAQVKVAQIQAFLDKHSKELQDVDAEATFVVPILSPAEDADAPQVGTAEKALTASAARLGKLTVKVEYKKSAICKKDLDQDAELLMEQEQQISKILPRTGFISFSLKALVNDKIDLASTVPGLSADALKNGFYYTVCLNIFAGSAKLQQKFQPAESRAQYLRLENTSELQGDVHVVLSDEIINYLQTSACLVQVRVYPLALQKQYFVLGAEELQLQNLLIQQEIAGDMSVRNQDSQAFIGALEYDIKYTRERRFPAAADRLSLLAGSKYESLLLLLSFDEIINYTEDIRLDASTGLIYFRVDRQPHSEPLASKEVYMINILNEHKVAMENNYIELQLPPQQLPQTGALSIQVVMKRGAENEQQIGHISICLEDILQAAQNGVMETSAYHNVLRQEAVQQHLHCTPRKMRVGINATLFCLENAQERQSLSDEIAQLFADYQSFDAQGRLAALCKKHQLREKFNPNQVRPDLAALCFSVDNAVSLQYLEEEFRLLDRFNSGYVSQAQALQVLQKIPVQNAADGSRLQQFCARRGGEDADEFDYVLFLSKVQAQGREQLRTPRSAKKILLPDQIAENQQTWHSPIGKIPPNVQLPDDTYKIKIYVKMAKNLHLLNRGNAPNSYVECKQLALETAVVPRNSSPAYDVYHETRLKGSQFAQLDSLQFNIMNRSYNTDHRAALYNNQKIGYAVVNLSQFFVANNRIQEKNINVQNLILTDDTNCQLILKNASNAQEVPELTLQISLVNLNELRKTDKDNALIAQEFLNNNFRKFQDTLTNINQKLTGGPQLTAAQRARPNDPSLTIDQALVSHRPATTSRQPPLLS